ncbi:hypothetical protein B0H19DRAFT_1159697, partial [Mycena capillaripes]
SLPWRQLFFFLSTTISPLSFVLIPVCTSHDNSFDLITSSTSKYFALSLSPLLVSLSNSAGCSYVFPQLIACW